MLRSSAPHSTSDAIQLELIKCVRVLQPRAGRFHSGCELDQPEKQLMCNFALSPSSVHGALQTQDVSDIVLEICRNASVLPEAAIAFSVPSG